MRLLVWGLGPVGAVTAACLAARGHEVTGIDPDDARRLVFERGEAPIREPGLAEIISRMMRSGALDFASAGSELIAASDASLVCVGAPDDGAGRYDTSSIEAVARAIGAGMAKGSSRHLAVLRSTVTPGITRDIFGKAIEAASGRRAGEGFELAFLPEFLREGSAVADFNEPSLVVVGADDPSVIGRLRLILPSSPPAITLSIEEAELAKLANNAFHALKIGFANEIGRLAKSRGIDGSRVMGTIASDRRLNLSAAYLAPGLAFGGPCLPKDLRALAAAAGAAGEAAPLIEGLLRSNERQHTALCDRIVAAGSRSVAILGLAFKSGTDDLRESTALLLAEELEARGASVVAHDFDVSSETLADPRRTGGQTIPPVLIQRELAEAIRGADAIVVTQQRDEYRAAILTLLGESAGPRIFDAVRLFDEPPRNSDRYEGIAW
jgi:GDP-mannose 6-dehydrogenase